MRHTRVYQGLKFSLVADPDLANEASVIFDAITKCAPHTQNEHISVWVGFWEYSLIRASDGYMVVAPGIRSDQRQGHGAGLSENLRIARAQRETLESFSSVASQRETRYNQKVIHHSSIKWDGEVYGERIDVDNPGDSGWYFGPTNEDVQSESFNAIWASDLIEICPRVVPYLQLPTGYLCVFGTEGLEAVVDPTGTTVFYESPSVELA